MEQVTNYQRTANWLAAAGKEIHNPDHISTQLACHLEELREQVELIRASQDGAAEVLARVVSDLEYLATAGKEGRVMYHIPTHMRTEFLKELCDGKVTTDGVAFLMGADMDEADKRVIDSNWSKFDANGKPVFLPGGKIAKSERYKKADLKGLM